MDKLTVRASKENLAQVLSFVDERLEEAGCSMKAQMHIDIAVEELFINIAAYAYAPGEGDVTVLMEITQEPDAEVKITLIDGGIQYDPLAKPDPDVSLSLQDRQIGGLGIYMAKKSLDRLAYERKDGQNILTLYKKLT